MILDLDSDSEQDQEHENILDSDLKFRSEDLTKMS